MTEQDQPTPAPPTLAHVQQRALEFVVAAVNPFAAGPPRGGLAEATVDRDAIYRFAAAHGVRPSLHRALLADGDSGAPGGLCDRLDTFQRGHTFKVMQMTAEIVSLAGALAGAGIAALCFKGAVLGEQIYGGAQFREFNDIDILVRPAQLDAAGAVLAAQEFRPVIADRAMRRGFFDYLRQHVFVQAGSGWMVDLHWDFVGTGPFPVSAADAIDHSARLALGGVEIPVPDRADQALILAGHGHKEGWSSFGWILDFAMFAARTPEIEWSEIARRACARRCLAPVLTGILLVERLFGHVIDARLAKQARACDVISRTVDWIVESLGGFAEPDYADSLMAGFRLCETRRQRLGMAWSLLTTRTIGDYEAMPLGPRWWWVYRVARPVRLVVRALAGAAPGRSRYWAGEARAAARRSG